MKQKHNLKKFKKLMNELNQFYSNLNKKHLKLIFKIQGYYSTEQYRIYFKNGEYLEERRIFV